MKLYVSPSTQEHNAYAGGGNEEQWMRELSTRICAHLIAAGHSVKMGGTVSAGTNAADGNAWGAERYIAVHSNAGGGRGTEVWAYKAGGTGAALAAAIYNRLAPATSSPDRGVKFSTGYIELSRTKAPACIIECAFHDNLAEANEIKSSLDEWSLAIAQGILDHVGGSIPVPPPVTPPPPVHVCPPDPHPSDANEQIAAYEARETKALALARDLVTLLSQ
jgi:N-acetylmuramoyl-L-alanine amidase